MKKASLTILSFLVFTACTTTEILDSHPEENNTIVYKDLPLTTDFQGAKISEEELLQGCPRKDCIPSIDNPQFESGQSADQWLNPEDTVFGLNDQGTIRAYPERILNWHEIVNDQINDKPVAITFCPLCGSALAFDRIVDGITTEFGVSGKLHNSDLVMYDRYEGNLWQQITGEAIVGPAARRGESLKKLPLTVTTWEQWYAEYPETEVLSQDTGFSRDYDLYPYGTYAENGEIFFGAPYQNKALHPKTIVYGITIDGQSRAYTEDDLKEEEIIFDTLANHPISLTYEPDGSVTVISTAGIDQRDNIPEPTRLFWFAWAAFNPDTTLYQ